MDIQVDLVSMLAQAQRAVGTNSIDRFVGNLASVAQIKPEALDKFDVDRWVDIYSDSLGLDPEIITPDEKVEAIRKQRAEAQAKAEQAAMLNQQADTAHKLAGSNTGEQNALTDATRAFSGYS